MKVSYLASSCLFIFQSGDVRAKNAKPSFISLGDFGDILNTEAVDDFENYSDVWNDAADFGWDDAMLFERKNRTYPFVVCSRVGGLSAKMRKKLLSNLDERMKTFNIQTIYNKDAKSCFLLTSYPSSMISIHEKEDFDVFPLGGSSAKFQRGTTVAMAEKTAIGLSFIFCPQSESTSTHAKGIGEDYIRNAISETKLSRGRNLIKSESFFWWKETSARREKKLNAQQLWSEVLSSAICPDYVGEVSGQYKGLGFLLKFPKKGEEILSHSCKLYLVASLAARPSICFVGPISNIESSSKNANWNAQSSSKNSLPFFDGGLTGRGQVVAVSDEPLDQNHCFFRDSSGNVDQGAQTGFNNTKRKIIQYVQVNDADLTEHATHVVGIIAGRESADGTYAGELENANEGIARDAKIAFYNLMGRKNGQLVNNLPSDIAELMEPGRNAGAKIHSASWSFDSYRITDDFGNVVGLVPEGMRGVYSFDSMLLDNYHYDHNDFLFITAAGNFGFQHSPFFFYQDIPRMLEAGHLAKNIIVVGATMNPDVADERLTTLKQFSTRGPTADNRIKPDCVAPGSWIVSARSNSECGTIWLEGTSMAAPVVSGIAALVRQYFEDGFYPKGKEVAANKLNPSAALVKAVLLNGAQVLTKIEYSDIKTKEYDSNQGFGRVSLINSLPLAGFNNFTAFIQDRRMLRDQEVDTFDFELDFSGDCVYNKEIRATIAWTDPANSPSCEHCLVNDLDLSILINGKVFYPNGRNEKDDTNNVERIRVGVLDSDRVQVSVKAANLDSEQDYALVVTGCLREQPKCKTVCKKKKNSWEEKCTNGILKKKCAGCLQCGQFCIEACHTNNQKWWRKCTKAEWEKKCVGCTECENHKKTRR